MRWTELDSKAIVRVCAFALGNGPKHLGLIELNASIKRDKNFHAGISPGSVEIQDGLGGAVAAQRQNHGYWKIWKISKSRKCFRIWSGRRESNPCPKLGKLLYCHCTTPARSQSY